jgi:hypothetical protein
MWPKRHTIHAIKRCDPASETLHSEGKRSYAIVRLVAAPSACSRARIFLSVSNIVSRSSGQCSRRYKFPTMYTARILTGSGFVLAHSNRSPRTWRISSRTTVGLPHVKPQLGKRVDRLRPRHVTARQPIRNGGNDSSAATRRRARRRHTEGTLPRTQLNTACDLDE